MTPKEQAAALADLKAGRVAPSIRETYQSILRTRDLARQLLNEGIAMIPDDVISVRRIEVRAMHILNDPRLVLALALK